MAASDQPVGVNLTVRWFGRNAVSTVQELLHKYSGGRFPPRDQQRRPAVGGYSWRPPTAYLSRDARVLRQRI